MTIKIEYIADMDLLSVTAKGRCSLEEYKTALDEITQSELYPPNINALWDLREQDFSNISTTHVHSLVSLRQRYLERDTARVSLIVNGHLAFGLSRMFEQILSIGRFNNEQHIKVFKDYFEGEIWLIDDRTILNKNEQPEELLKT